MKEISLLLVLFSFFNSDDDIGKVKNPINIRELERKMVKIEMPSYISAKNNIYVSKYEATNADYNAFLNNVKALKQIELYKGCIYDSSQWVKKFQFQNYGVPMMERYHSSFKYKDYPVVNVTYEGVVAYCKWLTKIYNKNPKRKYGKVIFRLPTEKEWIAASKPWMNNTFPWYGNQPYDEKGQFYANMKYYDHGIDGQNWINFVADGAILTRRVGSYLPNNLGLYDIIGNVSEMIDEKGVSKGGSWDNYINECGVTLKQNFIAPNPRLGFRIFMEVIEYEKQKTKE